MIKVLYEDNHLIAVLKPINVPTQKDSSNDIDMVSLVKDYLKKNYPELYEYIANEENPRTTIAICKVFPNETKDTLREKGFWYSGKNLDRLKKGAKTETWYVRDVLK